jgi:hypothetical protein
VLSLALITLAAGLANLRPVAPLERPGPRSGPVSPQRDS